MKLERLFRAFLIWRARHISRQQFVLMLSILIGLVVGLASSMLKRLVYALRHLVVTIDQDQFFEYQFLVYPLAGILLTLVFVRYIIRQPLGRGISDILFNLYQNSGLLSLHKTFSHFISSALTVGFGGSVGLEAPMIMTGSAIGSNLGRIFRMDYRRRSLLIGCGAAAAISSLFNLPVAGVIFSLEILLLELRVPSLIPLLLASVSANIISMVFSGGEILLASTNHQAFMIQDLPWLIALGIVTALVSMYFNRTTYWLEESFLKIGNIWFKALIAGGLLGLLVFVFPPLYGEGFGAIRQLLAGHEQEILENSLFALAGSGVSILLLFLGGIIIFKVFATSLTLAGGGNGGFFGPSIFVGAFSGFFFARLINSLQIAHGLNETNFALIGMAGAISGIMHAPFTAVFFIAEITESYDLMVPLILVSAFSYLTNKYFEPESIFTKQIGRKNKLLMEDKDFRVLYHLKTTSLIEKDLRVMHPRQTLGDLVEAVSASKRNLFPVVNETDEMVGIITLDDIRDIMFKPDLYDRIHVEEIMHPPPAFVNWEDDMHTVLEKFESSGAWNLPVLREGKYEGMLSKSKIFSHYRDMLILQNKEE